MKLSIPTWLRSILPLAAMAVLLGVSACAAPVGAPTTGGDPVSEAAEDQAEVDHEAMDHGEMDHEEEAEAEEAEADDTVADAQPYRGMGHNEDAMHRMMLDAGIERGLITEDDAAFFLTAHDAIDAYRPQNGIGQQLDDEAKAAMQRNLASMAVEEGTMSAEDAERFTAIHDILIEEGLMDMAYGGGMGQGRGMGMGQNEDAMHQQMLDAAIERGLMTEDDKAFFLSAHDAIEAYRPQNGVGKQLDDAAKAAMQRNLASMAVEEGTMSAEDAERFTALHDMLIEEGLMHMAEGGGMGQGKGMGVGAAEADAGAVEDLEARAAEMAEAMVTEMMLEMAVQKGWIDQEQQMVYMTADEALAAYRPEGVGALGQELPQAERLAMQQTAAEAAVADGALTQEQVDSFLSTFGRLLDEGLVP